MSRRALALRALALAVALGVSCHDGAIRSPPPCAPIVLEALDDDVVWGFADLHAHPGIERAFGGRLIWGSAIDDAPVSAAELPRIDACPVETHDPGGSTPIDRTVGGQIFPKLATLSGFAHAPVGSLGFRRTDAWPNARDLIHQQMNVASIRRAYEGGLRLMFASTTDDQVVSALLAGPSFVNGFVPSPSADYESARAQLELIQSIVEKNSTWMGIAGTPAQARRLIKDGKLALVLSLEMEGLTAVQVDLLVRDFRVQHIIPVHLVDNDIGGTAANGDLFNATSAEASSLYRSDHQPLRFMDVVAAPGFARLMGWPQTLGSNSPPVYVDLDDIPYSAYSSLCYEPLAACAGAAPTPSSFIEFGQRNLRGLCSTKAECEAGARPGKRRIHELFEKKMIVDVSHMSFESVKDTLAVDPERRVPIIASHGDIAHLCEGLPASEGCEDLTREPVGERYLDAKQAREIVGRGGVLGFGIGLGAYDVRALLVGRGGPLLTLDPKSGDPIGCVGSGSGCAAPLQSERLPLDKPVSTLKVSTVGGLPGTGPNAHPFVRVELRGPRPDQRYQRHVVVEPLACSSQGCSATVDLGKKDREAAPRPARQACDPLSSVEAGADGADAYVVNDIQKVTLEWLYLACDFACQKEAGVDVTDRQCKSTWGDGRAPRWNVDEVEVSAVEPDASEATLIHWGPTDAAPRVSLVGARGSVEVYARDDRTDAAKSVPASGHLLKVSLHSSPDGALLSGASPEDAGANVCVAVRHRRGDRCAPTPRPRDGAVECPTAGGWAPLNQRGAWASDTTLFAFVHSPEDESTVCGLDVAVLDFEASSPPLTIDEVRIEAMEDPVARWVRRYAQVVNSVAGGRLGAVGIGTDFNGLNGIMDISESPLPAATAPSACPAPGGGPDSGPQAIAPMRFRNADGSLGDEIRIDERGIATYGLLEDFLAIVRAYPDCGPDVYESVMLSAEMTLRAWEAIADPTVSHKPLPTRRIRCHLPPGVGP